MYTLLLLFIFTGSFFWYCSSAKVHIKPGSSFMIALIQNKSRARLLAMAVLSLSWIWTMYLQGALSGTLASGTYTMGFFSLIVLLWPYRYFQWKQLTVILLLSLFFELFVF